MVRRFLRLRIALFRAGFKTGNIGASVAAVLSLVWAMGAGMTGLVGGIALRFAPEEFKVTIVQVALAAIYLIWLLGPLTVAGTDAAMDPVKFVLLPLTRRDLAAGLGAASLVGPGGVSTSLTVLGLIAGLAPFGPGLLVVVLGGLLFLALCSISSRCLVSLVGIGLRRRGIRDILAVAIPLTLILFGQLPNILQNVSRAAGKETTTAVWHTILMLLRFLPSSFAAETMLGGHNNRLLLPLLEMAGGTLLCLALGWAWSVLLRRVMTTPPGMEGAARSRKARGFRTGCLVPWLSKRAGAVADKDLTLLFREPAQRVQLIMAVILGMAAAIIPGFITRNPLVGFIGAALGLLLGTFNSNLYGYDGSSAWVNVAAGDNAKADLAGKVIARLLVFTPVVALATVVLGVVAGPSLLPATLGCAIGTWLLCMGMATLQSVIAPYPVVYSEDSVMPRSQGSFQAVIAQFVGFPVAGLLMGPFIGVGMWWRANPFAMWAVGCGALVMGALTLYACYRMAVIYAGPRQPELLQRVSKRAEA